MTKLGIIGAMSVEVELLKEKMENLTVTAHADMEFYEGVLEGMPSVVVQCGVGKVNAAMCAQVLCSVFGVTHLVNTGIAGSLNAQLDIGDLVVSKDAMYHDFDCVHFGYEMGRVPGMDTVAFPADETMMGYALAAAETVNPGHTKTGALCTEMEGASIAHVAYRNKIPFVILRAISDKADDSAEMDYPTFERIAAHRCAEVTVNMAKQLRGA